MIKKLFFLLFFTTLLISCDDKAVRLVDSTGQLNEITVVMSNQDWDGQIGDTLRKHFARGIDGIIRDEPLFTMKHIKPSGFNGLLKKSRSFLLIQKGEPGVFVRTDKYANPQLGIVVQGNSKEDIITLIGKEYENMIKLFKTSEMNEKQRLMERVAMDVSTIENRYDIDIVFPSAYRYANAGDKEFTWLRRNISNGTLDFMIYEMPLETIKRDSNVVAQIVKMRDSIAGKKIEVNKPGIFRTEPAFSPYLYETSINGAFAYQTKGTWDIKDQFLAGPFINYAIYNKARNNWFIIEGYVYSPNSEQRDHLFEIESIVNSLKFKKSKE